MKAIFRLWVIVSILFSISSCSIKLDRTDCPCSLSIALEQSMDSFVLCLWRGGSLFQTVPSDSMLLEKYRYRYSVEKGVYTFTLSKGRSDVPSGSQADSLYAWSSVSELDARGESLFLETRLAKQFATLSAKVILPSYATGICCLKLSGDVDALDLQSLSPVDGKTFSCSSLIDGKGYASLRIPRQHPYSAEGSLNLFLEMGDRRLVNIPLWDYLDTAGYDWSAEDLEDISINIDCSGTQGYVYITPWEKGFDIETSS